MSRGMERFRIGDRVEIVGEVSDRVPLRVGIITSVEGTGFERTFAVTLPDGAESTFSAAQLKIPPAVSADLIFDTVVSPAGEGVRGAATGRHLRFVSRDIDIHLKLAPSQKNNNLIGQITENGAALKTSLVTLFLEGKPYARTATDAVGEFQVHQIRTGNALLELLVPSRRIVAPFEVSPA